MSYTVVYQVTPKQLKTLAQSMSRTLLQQLRKRRFSRMKKLRYKFQKRSPMIRDVEEVIPSGSGEWTVTENSSMEVQEHSEGTAWWNPSREESDVETLIDWTEKTIVRMQPARLPTKLPVMDIAEKLARMSSSLSNCQQGNIQDEELNSKPDRDFTDSIASMSDEEERKHYEDALKSVSGICDANLTGTNLIN